MFIKRIMKKTYLFTLLTILSFFNLKGQNLVLNPSFENVNIGNLQCNWYTTVGQFNNAINNWTLPTGGSTDIFHTSLGNGCYSSPFSTNAASVGQQAPRTGDAFVNIVTYGNGGCTPWREYIQGELSTPLVAGQTYEVKFYVSLADNMSVGTDNIGVKFETGPYFNASNCPYYTTPELNYTGAIILDKNAWTEISFCFTPTQSGFTHFIIGNFFNDAATNTAPASGTTSGNTIRYFVDDVSIELDNSTADPGLDGNLTICSTTSTFNLFDELGGTPDATGTWTGPSSLGGGNLGVFDPQTDAPGIYTYEVSGSAICSGGGGTATATVEVEIDSSNATITPAGPFCETDAAVNLDAAQSGGTWSGTGITDANAGTFDPSVAGDGTHSVTYDVGTTCPSSYTENIVVEAIADATISPSGPYCETDSPLNLSAADAGGEWSGTGITDINNGTFDPGTAGVGTHDIIYTVGNLCPDSDTIEIDITASPSVTVDPAGPLCVNDTEITLNASDPGGVWSGTGITDPNAGTFDPNVAGIGTHTISYNIGTTCQSLGNINIEVEAIADATIDPVAALCETDNSFDLTAADSGGTWSGTGITDANTGTFDPNVAGPGNHEIIYAVGNLCPDSDTIEIVINPLDDPAIDLVDPICQGADNIILTAETTPGNWSGNGIVDNDNGEFDPSVAGEGSHTISYVTDDLCPNTGTIDIEVLPVLTVQAFDDQEICEGETSTLSSVGNGGDANYSYNWTDDTGNNIGNTDEIEVSPISTTTYSVTLSDGCDSDPVSDSVTITVNPLPQNSFSADDTTGCAPVTVNLSSNSNQNVTCQWSVNGTTYSDCNLSHTFYDAGCHDVTLTVEENGCTNTSTIEDYICVEEYAEAEFTFSPQEITTIDTEVSFNNQSTNATDYFWDFGDEQSSDEINPIHEYPIEAQNYIVCLAALTNSGCNDTVCANIVIEDEVIFYVPNTFTPDADGFNDQFQAIFTQGYDPQNFHMLIFNRWGEVIWESYNADATWDGTYGNGEVVKDGTYIWKIEFKTMQNDEKITRTGHLNILR